MNYQNLSEEISILLPYKEGFSKKDFGSVSLYVKQINENSKFLRNVKIYSHSRYQPFNKFKVVHLPKSITHVFFGKNFGHTKSFIKSLNFKKKNQKLLRFIIVQNLFSKFHNFYHFRRNFFFIIMIHCHSKNIQHSRLEKN